MLLSFGRTFLNEGAVEEWYLPSLLFVGKLWLFVVFVCCGNFRNFRPIFMVLEIRTPFMFVSVIYFFFFFGTYLKKNWHYYFSSCGGSRELDGFGRLSLRGCVPGDD